MVMRGGLSSKVSLHGVGNYLKFNFCLVGCYTKSIDVGRAVNFSWAVDLLM
jgi:hypothetical protein